MSVVLPAAYGWARKVRMPGEQTAKLLLMTLAQYCDGDGHVRRRSLVELCFEIGIEDDRHVRRLLGYLEHVGAIERSSLRGRPNKDAEPHVRLLVECEPLEITRAVQSSSFSQWRKEGPQPRFIDPLSPPSASQQEGPQTRFSEKRVQKAGPQTRFSQKGVYKAGLQTPFSGQKEGPESGAVDPLSASNSSQQEGPQTRFSQNGARTASLTTRERNNPVTTSTSGDARARGTPPGGAPPQTQPNGWRKLRAEDVAKLVAEFPMLDRVEHRIEAALVRLDDRWSSNVFVGVRNWLQRDADAAASRVRRPVAHPPRSAFADDEEDLSWSRNTLSQGAAPA